MHDANPYLHVVGRKIEMKGKGAPKETVSGVIGHTEMSPLSKSLGGLVVNTTAGASRAEKGVAHHVSSHPKVNTDRHIVGHAAKTHVPGAHYGMVPYPGLYMSEKGHEL